MGATFRLYVSYTQIAAFDPDLSSPFNDWEDAHVLQGFSWRDASVSFATPRSDGPISVEVTVAESVEPSPDAMRAIVVPFDVPSSGRVEIATITESKILRLPADCRGLLYEAGVRDEEMWCRMSFVPGPAPNPRILRASGEMDPEATIVMTARPA